MEDWGGGLADVLPPQRSTASHATRLRSDERQAARIRGGERGGRSEGVQGGGGEPSRGDEGGMPTYDELMRLHLRDNPPAHAGPEARRGPDPADGRPAVQQTSQWTRVLQMLRPAPLNAAEMKDCECSVCLDAFSASSLRACKLPCGHIFHRRCITEWLRVDVRCPNCRHAVVN